MTIGSIAIDDWQLAMYIGKKGIDLKATIDRFGRIVMPKVLRDRHGLVPGSEVEIEDSGEAILLRHVTDLPGLVEKQGVLVFRGQAMGDLDSVVRSLRDGRLRASGGDLR